MNEEISIKELSRKKLAIPKRVLLGPGPSLADPRVLEAMSLPLVGHLDPFFVKLMDETQELLRYVFCTSNKLTIPISGTGSAAMEASIANTVEPGDSVLICINGYFGERLAEMAKRYGGNVYIIRKKWGEVFSPEEVKLALEEKPVKIVGLVHAETSTGALQPLEEITKIVHNHGALLIVDAVTSLGGIPILVDDIGIDVCYSGTQKCLSCPPGLGPITFGPKAIDKLQNRKLPVTSWYLDLSLVHKYWGGERTYHHTAPISSIYALYEGLRIIAEEGLENRWIRHQKTAELFWEGLEQIGLECHVDYKNRLPSLTTIKVPEGVDELSVRQRLLNDYFIEIAGGLGELKGKVWRVGFMGYSSNEENVYLLLEALKAILK